MPAAVRCPNPKCSRLSSVPDAAAGRRVRCPGCGTAFDAASGTARPVPLSATKRWRLVEILEKAK